MSDKKFFRLALLVIAICAILTGLHVYYILHTYENSSIIYYVSEEFWWRLYKPGDNIIDQLRSVIGVQYIFNKRHSMDVFFRADNEVQVKNPENVFSVGITYSFSGPLKFKRKKVTLQEDSF